MAKLPPPPPCIRMAGYTPWLRSADGFRAVPSVASRLPGRGGPHQLPVPDAVPAGRGMRPADAGEPPPPPPDPPVHRGRLLTRREPLRVALHSDLPAAPAAVCRCLTSAASDVSKSSMNIAGASSTSLCGVMPAYCCLLPTAVSAPLHGQVVVLATCISTA